MNIQERRNNYGIYQILKAEANKDKMRMNEMNWELYIDLTTRWSIIDYMYINTDVKKLKENLIPVPNRYHHFFKKLGYEANVYGGLDCNFAYGLAKFIEWAEDKDFILKPYCRSGNIDFEKLGKILKYCCVIYKPIANMSGTKELVMLTDKVCLVPYGDTGVSLREWYGDYEGYPIGVEVSTDEFYELANKTSLKAHGKPIREIQEKIDFEALKKKFAKYGNGDRDTNRFGRDTYKYIRGKQTVWANPFAGSSLVTGSSFNGIPGRVGPNLGYSDSVFDDYYGEY